MIVIIILLILYILFNNMSLMLYILGRKNFNKKLKPIDLVKMILFGGIYIFLNSEK